MVIYSVWLLLGAVQLAAGSAAAWWMLAMSDEFMLVRLCELCMDYSKEKPVPWVMRQAPPPTSRSTS